MRTKLMVLGAVTLAGTQLACAEIGLRDPRTQERVLSTTTEHVPVSGHAAGSVDALDGTTLTVRASKVCDAVMRSEVGTTTVQDRYNTDPTTTWAYGLGGIAAAAAGTAILVDSGNVYPDDETSRTYNPTGPTKAVAWGTALTATGIALGTIAVVDVLRAQGTETTRTISHRDGDPESRGPCPNAPLAGAAVTGRASSTGETYRLGDTGPDGRLSVDLDALLPQEFDWSDRRLDVLIDAEPIGHVDLSTVFERRENAAWTALPLAECRNPTTSTSCDSVQRFLDTYPNGPHSAEGAALLKEMSPALSSLGDKESWLSSQSEDCRGGTFETPEEGEQSCRPYREYLKAYPGGAHAGEARKILEAAEKRLSQLRREREAAEKKALAEQRAEEARQEAEAKKRCIGRCKVGCSSWRVANQSACFTGCVESQCSGGDQW